MNVPRTPTRTAPLHPPRRRAEAGMLIGGAVAFVWAGAMLYTLASWIF
ncbi:MULTISPECIES: morphogenic membrane protein MmpA [unclassified Streptomyces]